ncbi:unnamed protein product [Fusarium venenatum]|uniref:Uncharacterized protein n=1 Tax=Fusarium venenatum TaxID=56646 RepID=A0A2L2T3R7_9HYPO|nr:uncharacterized protein FVRRES_01906 [Fusarium venenatum]CEI65394.1 unnamed protein product [Fusarium venenatum]
MMLPERVLKTSISDNKGLSASCDGETGRRSISCRLMSEFVELKRKLICVACMTCMANLYPRLESLIISCTNIRQQI